MKLLKEYLPIIINLLSILGLLTSFFTNILNFLNMIPLYWFTFPSLCYLIILISSYFYYKEKEKKLSNNKTLIIVEGDYPIPKKSNKNKFIFFLIILSILYLAIVSYNYYDLYLDLEEIPVLNDIDV